MGNAMQVLAAFREMIANKNISKDDLHDLINELLPEVNTALPPSLAKNKIPSALCNVLNKDPESPFCGLIRRQTTDKGIKAAVVKDNSGDYLVFHAYRAQRERGKSDSELKISTIVWEDGWPRVAPLP